jgi:hypothetical protein
VHVAGYNLGLIMRLLVGAGTPREYLAGAVAHLVVLTAVDGVTCVIVSVASGTKTAMLLISFAPSRVTEVVILQRAALMFAVKYLVASVRPGLSADGMLA